MTKLPLTLKDLRKDEQVKAYILKADETLATLGYTEHGVAHVSLVADTARRLLADLGHDAWTCEMAALAGYLHDIGNLVNRHMHAQSGALMAEDILERLGLFPLDVADIVTAIGHHDESTAFPVSDLAAALILADKSDVRRSRVRKGKALEQDIHDRVNYAVTDSQLTLSKEDKQVTLTLTIDDTISSISDYFEIFMGRMILCRKAADKLGLSFSLVINGQKLM